MALANAESYRSKIQRLQNSVASASALIEITQLPGMRDIKTSEYEVSNTIRHEIFASGLPKESESKKSEKMEPEKYASEPISRYDIAKGKNG